MKSKNTDSNIKITQGNKKEAVKIMQEAALWLIASSKKMWSVEEVSYDNLQYPNNDFVVLWKGNISVASMILTFEDDYIWTEAKSKTSGIIHKLSVKRDFAGMGYSEKLIEYAKKKCSDSNLQYLRLDCDANRKKLCAFYERNGFSLFKIKKFNSKRLGFIKCALYEMKVI
jgi:ribosomal protein S18 acetylase RimI-like enzyme